MSYINCLNTRLLSFKTEVTFSLCFIFIKPKTLHFGRDSLPLIHFLITLKLMILKSTKCLPVFH